MARLSLERAISYMMCAGFDYEENHGTSRHYFVNNKNGIQKSFATGREVVRFVLDKGATVTSIMDWEDELTGNTQFSWINKYADMKPEDTQLESRQRYINVLTGEDLGVMTENEFMTMFEF